MKKIIVKFLTKKGEKAYHKVEEAGKQESKINKRIMKMIARDNTISKEPLTIEIEIKIPRLAIKAEMPEKIVEGLAKFDAVKGIDYTMDIQY